MYFANSSASSVKDPSVRRVFEGPGMVGRGWLILLLRFLVVCGSKVRRFSLGADLGSHREQLISKT